MRRYDPDQWLDHQMLLLALSWQRHTQFVVAELAGAPYWRPARPAMTQRHARRSPSAVALKAASPDVYNAYGENMVNVKDNLAYTQPNTVATTNW